MDIQAGPKSSSTSPHKPPCSELRWSVHPLLQEPPGKSALLLAIVLGLSAGVAFSFNSGSYGFLCFALITTSLSRYFFPTRYALNSTGVQTSHLGVRRRVPWEQIRRCRIDPDGVFFSPFNRSSRLDPFRGCFLRFGNNRNEVIEFVRPYIPHRSP
jgi:hypothetical protein